jgi:hypothetical protein
VTNVSAFKVWLADFSAGQGHVSET